MARLRYDHFVLLDALEGPGHLPCDKLPIKGMTAATLVRRNLAEWVRPERQPHGKAIALRITDGGRDARRRWSDAFIS